jgi:hypothetical protein
MPRRLPALAMALAVAACATIPDVRTDFDPAANFSGYRSYSWIYTAPPQGMNPLMYDRVRASIDRSLAARSFVPSPNGQFAIAFTLGARDRVEVNDLGVYGPYYPVYGRGYRFGWAPAYNAVSIDNVTDGTLAIDIYDAATKKPVWHGVATQEIVPGQVSQETIDTAVDAVLARFPPTASGGD